MKSFSLPTVLTIAPKRLFSESTMTLLCPLTIKNLLFWFYWTCLLLLIQLIILFSLLDYLPVLAFVTRHWTGFRSYLSDRTQYVRIQDVSSDVHALPYGVPQGSVLGPLLYSLYTFPLGDIARSHGLSYHFYTI